MPCNLSDAQFERLKKELGDLYQSAANAGRPMVPEGGLDWKAMSLSPKDMDFMEVKHSAAREIALAFGVPPMLLADSQATIPIRITRKPTVCSGARPSCRSPTASARR